MLNKHKTIIFTLLTFIFILITAILIKKTFGINKENFSIYSLRQDSNPDSFTISELGTFQRAKIVNISEYMLLQNPIPEKDPLVFLDFDDVSYLSVSRKEENQDKEFTFGFYLAKTNILKKLGDSSTDDEPYNNTDNLLTIYNNDDEEVVKVKILANNSVSVTSPIDDDNVISDLPLQDTNNNNIDNNDISYIVLSLNYNSDDFIPELKININNTNYSMKLTTLQAQKINIKKFIFGTPDNSSNGFDGFIGNVTMFNKILDKLTFCQYFNCDISCYVPPPKYRNVDDRTNNIVNPLFKTYDGNVNGCIKDCMLNCDNIERCQKICVNCEVEGRYWSDEEKNERCPWLSEIKIQDMSVPEAPEIRGFPGDRSILIEWKKPFDGRSDITNYIVMYYESFDKSKGIQVSISGKSTDDIYSHEIKNLKNRKHYDIVVRAVNNQGIGKPSNIITVSPNGNVTDGSSSNIYNDLENEVDREINKMTFDFVCDNVNYDSVGHTLDYYDEDAMDIKNYIQNIK